MKERYIIVIDRMGDISPQGSFFSLVIDTDRGIVVARLPQRDQATPIADALNLTVAVRERTT